MKKLATFLLFAMAIGQTGCNNLIEGININPNVPTEAPSDNILTGAQVALIQVTEGDLARKSGLWAGYFRGEDRQYEGFYNYLVTAGDFSANWEDIYANVVRNALITRQTAEAEGNQGVISGITKVLSAIGIGTSASLWGNVPFTQAGDYVSYPTPIYEDQLAVFQGLQALLDEAIIDLASGTGQPGAGADIFFNGNAGLWTEVAYTLKARFYLLTREYQNAYDAAQQGISSPDNTMYAPHQDIVGAQNLYYQFFTGNRADDLSASGTTVSLLLDPSSAAYRGNAKTDETARFNHLFITFGNNTVPNTAGIFAPEASFPLVSYQENLLILAEAGLRGQGLATGLGHLNEFRAYMAGGGYITNSSLPYLPYDAADFAAGGLENPDNIDPGQALLREILEERYITFFGQVIGFNDVLRTLNETVVRVPVPPNAGGQIPQRLLYPQTEVDRNPNVPSPIPGIFVPTPVNQ